MSEADRLQLVVADVRAEACDVVLLELRGERGAALPPFKPGAHLELKLPNSLVRHYSLCNDWRDQDRYLVAVGRSATSRGGSEYVHQQLRCGTPLTSSPPRNQFALDEEAAGFVFVAGGIGITPIHAMVRWCQVNQRPWRLVYAARSRQRAAFYESLRTQTDHVHFHFDDECGELLDVGGALAGLRRNEQIYCCGPSPLVSAVKAATGELSPGRVKFEYFSAPQEQPPQPAPGEFRVELKRSGITFEVPADRSILDMLEQRGVEVPFSCREGLCRTCETSVIDGTPEHRDYVLSQQERQCGKSMMVCVSRSSGPVLVLDL